MEVHMNVINLKQKSGCRYKVTFEESYNGEHGEHGRTDDPWLMVIPAQHGHFFPHGEATLAFATDKSGLIARQLRELDFTEILQDGDDGVNIAFPVERFEEVASIVKPKRRRRLSERHRCRLLQAGRSHRFGGGDGPQNSPAAGNEGRQPVSADRAKPGYQGRSEGARVGP
jgi:hypothetical protein